MFLLILAMGVVTFGLRFAPLALAGDRALPGWLTSWLSFVTPAVFVALVVPVVLGPLVRVGPGAPQPVAALVAVLAARRLGPTGAMLLAMLTILVHGALFGSS